MITKLERNQMAWLQTDLNTVFESQQCIPRHPENHSGDRTSFSVESGISCSLFINKQSGERTYMAILNTSSRLAEPSQLRWDMSAQSVTRWLLEG